MRPDRSQVSQSTRFPEQAAIDMMIHRAMHPKRIRHVITLDMGNDEPMFVDSEAYSKIKIYENQFMLVGSSHCSGLFLRLIPKRGQGAHTQL
jgi:hypothetical protein